MSLRSDVKISPRRKVVLAQYCTMQVGGPAEYFGEPKNEEELSAYLEFARNEGLPCRILGKGSNVLFPDEGYPGIVLRMTHYEEGRADFDPGQATVDASAGIYLAKLAMLCRDRGFSGTEFLAGIPGTLGGALIMNAGFSRVPGVKREIGPMTLEVTALEWNGTKRVLSKEDLKFSYRNSNLGDKILLSAKLKLAQGHPEEIGTEMRANLEYRNAKQDLKHPSCGSVFKNPPAPHPPAAKIIDDLGLKGSRVGGMMISEKHSNYLINAGGGTCEDAVCLIRKIQEAVFHATGVQLETEVRIIQKP